MGGIGIIIRSKYVRELYNIFIYLLKFLSARKLAGVVMNKLLNQGIKSLGHKMEKVRGSGPVGDTCLQLLLTMARNLSIGTKRKKRLYG